jgi:poly(A) polymerase
LTANAPPTTAAPPIAATDVPRVIAREHHCISRQHISPNALRVLYRLRDAGYEAHLVGGAVRDLLLGGRPKDFDIATSATPEQVKQQFRNCRLIGRRFRLAHVVFGQEVIEVATFRAGGDDGSGDRHVVDGRIVRDNVYGTIADDARRRDFTINALYYAIEDFSVRDYVGGFDDLRNRVLRLIGDVEQRYREDPVRMMRAVRLAAKLGFRIEDQAWAAIARLAPLIAEAAPARLFDEIIKLFMSGHAHESFRWLEASGLLHQLLPATANALAERGNVPTMLDAALRGTDQRLAQGKSVTPVFLMAALFWPAVKARWQVLVEQGVDTQVAMMRAGSHVVHEQAARIAMPKRFTLPMQEIWVLQLRFTQLVRKKVMRLMAHPRFRAAFDFLCLRGLEEPEARELANWWQQAQTDTPHVLEHLLAPGHVPSHAVGEVRAPPSGRKRRRGRRGRGRVGTGATPDTIRPETPT